MVGAAHHWRATQRANIEIIEQHRDPDRPDGLFWPLKDAAGGRLEALNIDAIVCLAGVTPGPGTDLSQNTPLAEAVLGAAHHAGISRVLLASSSAVYGAGDGTPFAETDATASVNPYGAAKVMMEQACTPWRDAGGEVCCMRIGNVAGADALLLNAVRAPEQPLTIDRFPDGGSPMRSYIGAATLADVLCGLATQPEPLPDVLNMAAPGVVGMADLAHAANHPVIFRHAPEGAHQKITLDCQRLAALHAFTADASDPSRMVAQWKETLPR